MRTGENAEVMGHVGAAYTLRSEAHRRQDRFSKHLSVTHLCEYREEGRHSPFGQLEGGGGRVLPTPQGMQQIWQQYFNGDAVVRLALNAVVSKNAALQ